MQMEEPIWEEFVQSSSFSGQRLVNYQFEKIISALSILLKTQKKYLYGTNYRKQNQEIFRGYIENKLISVIKDSQLKTCLLHVEGKCNGRGS